MLTAEKEFASMVSESKLNRLLMQTSSHKIASYLSEEAEFEENPLTLFHLIYLSEQTEDFS